MSRVFFREPHLPEPDVYLGIGSGSHTAQTARVITGIEPVLADHQPHVVLVPGDVNSTLAAALTAKQAGFRLGHVKAGLRSFDRSMPEELNRVLTDQLSDFLFTHSPEAREYLLAEGRSVDAIHEVGNTMIDTLVFLQTEIEHSEAAAILGLDDGGYVLVTLHRPALVDGPQLVDALAALSRLADSYEVVFPVHPRTRARIETLGPMALHPRLRLVEPVSYLSFVALMRTAAAVLTDSGGVQEESIYLGVPCFTPRANTERPVTIELGTNRLLGLAPRRIVQIPELLTESDRKPRSVPPGWDGQAASRIVTVLRRAFQ
jgi:UDP-N-acetylglucosamine 2-epimerase (non-hydrolysing)